MSNFDKRLKAAYIYIHGIIHDPTHPREFQLGTVRKPVHMMGGMRAVTYDDITFVEQNPRKNTIFAERTRNGEHITWGIPIADAKGVVAPWIYIDDDIATKFDNHQNSLINATTNSPKEELIYSGQSVTGLVIDTEGVLSTDKGGQHSMDHRSPPAARDKETPGGNH